MNVGSSSSSSAASYVSQRAETQQAVAANIIKQQAKSEQAVADLVEKSAQNAARIQSEKGPGVGTRLDKTV